jgi:hypothetical protein
VVGSVAGNGELFKAGWVFLGWKVLAEKSWRLLFLSASKGEKVLAGKVKKVGEISASMWVGICLIMLID